MTVGIADLFTMQRRCGPFPDERFREHASAVGPQVNADKDPLQSICRSERDPAEAAHRLGK
jgi:hypothetical protein